MLGRRDFLLSSTAVAVMSAQVKGEPSARQGAEKRATNQRLRLPIKIVII
jgi:hypothetical protein